jgi:type I restriction enzyme S subunit
MQAKRSPSSSSAFLQTRHGKVPTDWPIQPLGKLAEVGSGVTLGRDLDGTTTVELPYLRVENVQDGFLDLTEIKTVKVKPDEVNRFLLQPGDVLMTEGGDFDKLGRGCIWQGEISPCLHQNHIFRVRADQGRLAPGFLSVLISSGYGRRYFLRISKQTTNLATINKTQLRAFPVPCPPLDEQRAIARILDAADTAIESMRAAIAKARRLRDGLVQALLSNGIGPDGQIRSRKAFPERYQTTKAGWLPGDWQLSTVGAEFEVGTGFTLDESRRPRVNKVKYLRVANVQRGCILLDEIAELEATEEEAATRRLKEGDLVVVEGHADPNAIGRCARVPKAAEGLCFQNHLFRLRAKEMDSSFASLWLNSEWARRYWRGRCATSSGLNTINQRMLKALLIPKPDLREQAQIGRLVGEAEAQIDRRERSLDHLSRIKRGLMQDLLTGRVRVNGKSQ